MQTIESLKKILPHIRPYRNLILVSLVLAIPMAALQFGPVPLVGRFVDDVLRTKDRTMLALFPLALIGIFVLRFFVRFFHQFLIRIVVARVNQNIRNRIYQHLLGLSADYFTEKSTGNLISRAGTDAQHLDGGIQSIGSLIKDPIVFCLALGRCFYLNWSLTLTTLCIIPPLAWAFSRSGRLLKRYMHKIQEENANVFDALQETFTGIRVVKIFNLNRYVSEKFQKRTQTFADTVIKSAKLQEITHPLIDLLTGIAIAGVIYYGGSLVIRGELTEGQFIEFFLAFALIMDPLRKLNDANIKINHAASASDRIHEILEWKPKVTESDQAQPLSTFSQAIQFTDVRFSYPDEPTRNILNSISFEAKKGEITAFVGSSGSGKTTLMNLLPRLFDVTSGRISIDGTNIKDFRLSDLRNMIAVVSQDVFLFNDTIEENIRCGKLDASPEDIKKAAERANALDFIEKQPFGFQTVIGDRGQKLSGGERQRLSIARAFLRESPILILDEATSNLDSASEKAVQEALEVLMKNRTTLVIAHRLSTIKNADQIHVMKNGSRIESGRHEELMEKQGEYFRLNQLQQS